MNVKNINPFEQHVEKIALAVAVAGAAYMIYLAYPPTLTIPGSHGEAIPADKVEEQVTLAVRSLEEKREETRKKGTISVSVPNFEDQYRNSVMKAPLPAELVRSDVVPPFVPLNLALKFIPGGPQNSPDTPRLTPGVPAPTEVSALAWVGVVVPAQAPPAGQPAAVAAPVAGKPADKHLVIIKGVEDLGKMLKEMADTPAAQRLPGALQRAVIYRVEAQRRERQGDVWGSWEEVKRNPMLTALPVVDWSKLRDADLQPTVDMLAQQIRDIVNPEYFLTPEGGSVVQQLLKGETGVIKPIAAVAPPPAVAPPVAWPGGAPGGGGPGRSVMLGDSRMLGDPRGPGRGGGSRMPGGGSPAGGPGMPPAGWPGGPGVVQPGVPAGVPTGLAAGQTTVPFWVLDDDVKPGQEYQYQVRIAVYNPTYRWPNQLAEPAMKVEPLLRSAWVMAPKSVVTKSDLYFFMMGAIDQHSANPRVSARVYKYSAGKWYVGDANAQPGLGIKASIRLASLDAKPAVPAMPGLPGMEPKPAVVPTKETEVDTHHTVVDVSADGEKVLLLGPEGELETRDARIDRDSPIKSDLEREIAAARPIPVPATQPATRPFIPPPPPSPFGPGGGGSRILGR